MNDSFDEENDIEECSAILTTDEAIQQGDILFFSDGKDCEKYGVVVTGDCDLAQGKFGDSISYCFILTLEEYINNFILSKKWKKILEKEKECIKRELKTLFKIKEISEETFGLLEESEEQCKNYINDKHLFDLFCEYSADKKRGQIKYSDYEQVCQRIKQNPKTKYKFEEEIVSHILKSLPGDKYYINDLPVPNRNAFGYIVNLRRIYGINPDEIARSSDWKDKTAIRIGRLNAPFKQKLIQTLAQMFSDIGIPEKNEKFRNECLHNEIKEILL